MISMTKDNTPLFRELLARMWKIRLTEEAIAEKYPHGKMRCPTHLCTGQEAVSAAVGYALRPDDFAVSTHRAHGHYLGKGGDLRKMMAEIYGKAAGCSRGKGGSMHLIDKSVSFMGSTAIVGGTIPLGVGLGLSIKLHGTDQISCVFLGDGSVEEGVFYESVNFAVLKRLPVLFVCENNLYSVYSPLKVRQPEDRKIFQMVQGMGCSAHAGDGNDCVEVYSVISQVLQEMRQGAGPVFFEFSTYRWREHCGPFFDNDLGYRTEAEYLSWKDQDPVLKLQRALLEKSLLTQAEVDILKHAVQEEVNMSFEFAENSEFPEPGEAYSQVYAI